MDQVAERRHYVFQQDGAPAHNSKRTQDSWRENLPEFWENPLNYFVWGISELHGKKCLTTFLPH
jgi:hypothetical protein